MRVYTRCGLPYEASNVSRVPLEQIKPVSMAFAFITHQLDAVALADPTQGMGRDITAYVMRALFVQAGRMRADCITHCAMHWLIKHHWPYCSRNFVPIACGACTDVRILISFSLLFR